MQPEIDECEVHVTPRHALDTTVGEKATMHTKPATCYSKRFTEDLERVDQEQWDPNSLIKDRLKKEQVVTQAQLVSESTDENSGDGIGIGLAQTLLPSTQYQIKQQPSMSKGDGLYDHLCTSNKR